MRVSPARINAEVRRLLALPEGAARPVAVDELARSQDIAVVYEQLEGDEDISGFYLREGANAVIGVNADHARVRQRFTIAHELGHATLDRRQGMHIDRAFRLRDTTSALAIDAEEIAANAFAAALLMPEEEVRAAVADGLDISEDGEIRALAKRFGVSQQAIMYRLVNLGLTLDGRATF